MKLQNKIAIVVFAVTMPFMPMLAQGNAVAYAPVIPEKVHFADRVVDLDRIDFYERMDREMISFAFGHTNTLLTIKRANRYAPGIVKILKEQGVPEDLVYLAAIESHYDAQIEAVEWIKVIPYLIVLATALAGINVMLVLFLGILTSGLIGILSSGFDLFGWFGAMGAGITGMGELIIITLLAGGMLEMIRYNGGIDYIIVKLTRHVNSKRAGELSIAGLVCLANLCTANNTIAVITIGPIAKNIADRFGIDCRKSASILDTFSCFIQGIIPYGAQMLIAAGLASISPLSIIQYLYYPMLIGICALSAIVFRYPRRYS